MIKIKINYLPINIDNIEKEPDSFITTINKKDFVFEVSWNPEVKAFFVNLYDREEKPILLGIRIVYGQDILENLTDSKVKIIPLDKTGTAKNIGITFNNFMRDIKPYIIVGEQR